MYFAVAFKMYDLDNDDLISQDELTAVLHMMVGNNIPKEQVCPPAPGEGGWWEGGGADREMELCRWGMVGF